MKQLYSICLKLCLTIATLALIIASSTNLSACTAVTSGSGNGNSVGIGSCGTYSSSINVPSTGYGLFTGVEAGGVYYLDKVSGPAGTWAEVRSGLNSGTVFATGNMDYVFQVSSGTNAYVSYFANSGCGTDWTGSNSNGGSAVLRLYRYSPNASSTPSINTTCSSTTLTASASPIGGFTPAYQWQGSNDNSSWTNISGATSTSMTTTSYTQYLYYRHRSGYGSCYSYSPSVMVLPRTTFTGNVTISSNITLGGTYNINGNFTVNSGVTVTVVDNCELTITANNITMSGTINGNGRGANGGSGAGGGVNYSQCSNDDDNYYTGGGAAGGSAGGGSGGGAGGNGGGNGYGRSRGCGGFLCIGNSDGHFGGGGGGAGGGGGSYGGTGGVGGYGSRGGWFNSGEDGYGNGGSGGSAGGTYTSVYDVSLGSGGGGAGGGGGARYGGSGGGSGGDGGGSVSLIANNTLSLTGTITVDGNNGGTGGNGSAQADGSWDCTTTNCGTCSICFGNEVFSAHGGAGGGAGGGSGGGIRIQAFGNLNLTGTLSAEGGNGGSAGIPDIDNGPCNPSARGGGGGGGGRIKVILNPCADNNISPTTDVSGGAGGSGNGNTGASGGSGSYESFIVHPSYSPPTAGTISTSQTICTGGSPSAFTGTAASGGTGSYTYNWYSCTGGSCPTPVTNNPVAGAGWTNRGTNATGFNEPNNLTQTTTYVRGVESGECYNWSNIITVTVAADPSISITTSNQTICSGGNITFFTSVSGGTGTQTYQWQSSPNNSTWSNISGATSASYNTGALSSTTYFRVLRNASGIGCNQATSNVVTVTVVADPSVSITTPPQTICDGGSLTLNTSISGGTGSNLYQWQSSPNNSTWSNVGSLTTSTTLSTGALSSSTYYRVIRSANGIGCDDATSASVLITVVADPSINIATSPVVLCNGGSITLTTTTSGGTGTLTNQWQSSPNNSSWTDISGATGFTYNTGALSSSTYYRVYRSASGIGCDNIYSSSVLITVVNDPTISITTPSQDICYQESLTLSSSTSGGTGTCTYQWQSSPNNSTWNNISGATSATYNTGPMTATTYYRLLRPNIKHHYPYAYLR